MLARKTYYIMLIAASLIAASVISLYTYKGGEDRYIVFFSGAGMKIPVSEIVRDFTKTTGMAVDVHFEGSAVLRRHIESYGDADLFLSGDKKNMELLVEKGLVKEHTFIAWHIPVILIPPENRDKIKGLNDLAKKGTRFIMSNPAHASSGRLFHDMLQRHPKGKAILKNVVVYGSSTADTLRLFRELREKGGVDAVVEWDIMVHVPEGSGLIAVPFEREYEIKDSLMLAILKASGKLSTAGKFYDYFRTKGIDIFKKHGYNTEAGK